MEKWIRDNLSKLLYFEVPDDMVQFIMKMENERDLDNWLKTLLDFGNSTHRQFVVDLKKARFSCAAASSANKKNSEQNFAPKPYDKKKGKSKENQAPSVTQETQKPVERVEKKKTKFVDLYSQEGKDRQTIVLKGRNKCDCEAKTHALINNCLTCGRIVCAQEGSGPCLFCDTIVCTPEEQTVLSSKTKQSDTLYNKLKSQQQKVIKVSDAALKHRDKLLEYDRNSARRTEVIDDENDYYQSSNSVWLSSAEREKMQKREEEMRNMKYQSRLTRKVTVDFAGREVFEEAEDFDDAFNTELRESAESMMARVSSNANVCPTIEFDRPTYIEMNLLNANKSLESKLADRSDYSNRIQDKEYKEMVDEGVCLSMHQPYASLLVAGIKTHEGRDWYTSHRGRLWIAAASKIPAAEDISTMENRYRVLLNENIKFPDSYPTACLLGCVTVTDVLPQEEYRRIYPEGDSESPYVFICQDFHELSLKFPVKGQHKIYKLEKKIHQAAMKSLEAMLKIRST